MNGIVEKAKEYAIERSNKFEEETRGTKDEYNLYNDHIESVYKYVCMISKDKKVDHEVLKLSALLHDISMTDKKLDREKHNEYSSLMAEKFLRENNYPEDKIHFVKKCIINHISSRIYFRQTEEEKMLVDADSLAHFDSIKSLYNLAYDVLETKGNLTLKFIQDKLTRDYNEISDELKPLIQEKYDKIMSFQNTNELLEYIEG